jgi:hypothetical protein
MEFGYFTLSDNHRLLGEMPALRRRLKRAKLAASRSYLTSD